MYIQLELLCTTKGNFLLMLGTTFLHCTLQLFPVVTISINCGCNIAL
jgi:hypothetical protein